MISKRFSAELNCLRWIAALLVVISHLRNLLFVDYNEVTDKDLAVKLFYFITGFGHEAVIVFFVISGFLVGGLSLRKYLDGRFDAGDFAVHRFSRIYIVLVPALAACYALDWIGLHYFHSPLYSQSMQFNFSRVFSEHMDWATLLGNLLMLQHVSVEVLGSNGALWSLSYEWWYYSMFFCAIGIASPSNGRLARLLYGLALALMVLLLPAEILLWFAIWLLGAALAVLPLQRMKIKPVFAGAVFLAVLVWSRFDHTYTEVNSIYMNFVRDSALATGCLLLFAALGQPRPSKEGMGKLHAALAEFSYTTYLVHLPFLVFVAAVLRHFFQVPLYQQPGWQPFLHFAFLLCLVYVYSYAFSRLTEAHTDRLRSWLGSLCASRRREPGSPAAAGRRRVRREINIEAGDAKRDDAPRPNYLR